MATWSFSNDYLEEKTGADLDGSGVSGDGTPGNATAPTNLSIATYAAGDDYLVEGTLASKAALDAVKSFFSTFNTAQGITFDARSAFTYTNVAGTAANLKTLSSTDIGNITSTLTVSDSWGSPTSLSDLQSIKANYSGTSFAYYGIQGTTKDLADSRNDAGFDWIKNISAQRGAKSFTLTDLGLNTSHLSALIGTGADALDNTYLINQQGLTSDSSAYLGAIGGTSLAYRSAARPDATTSYLLPITTSSSPYTNHVVGLANTASPNPSTFADFNVTGDDAASGLSFTTHFYAGEQLSHISLSSADLATTNGYSYSQTAGASTASDLSDDIWTLSLNLTPGQPSISGSVADNSNSSLLGLILHTIGSSAVGTSTDLGASVFRTGAWWNDISANDPTYKFSDNCPGININGSNGDAIDFNFYLSKSYLERTFSVDFDAIDGGFAASGLSSVSSDNESTGSYIDVSKSGAISSLKLPVTVTDVSATTAGGSTDLYQVAFSNDSWSQGNLSLVYGPSVASTITGDTSGSGEEDGDPITGTLAATDPQGLTDNTYFTVSTDPSNGSASINAETGAWSYTPTANFNGTDSFIVTVTDDLGGKTTQQIGLTISDTPEPSPKPSPTAPDLSVASDSGSSNSDNLSNDTTPTFTGTAEANSSVELFAGSTSIGSSTADNSGNWSHTVQSGSALTGGTHSITAKATDSAGNTSSASNALSLTIDTSTATPSTPDLITASDSGSSSTDNITNDTTPTFTGTAEANSSVELFTGSTSLGTTTADNSGNWSYNDRWPYTLFADGTYSITAKATDAAGNSSASSTALSLTIIVPSQSVFLDSNNIAFNPGNPIDFDLKYKVSNGRQTLGLTNLNIYYDSDLLTPKATTGDRKTINGFTPLA